MLARYYAEALFALLGNEKKSEFTKTVKHFTALLKKRGHERLLPSIVRELHKVEEKQNRRKTIFISAPKILTEAKQNALLKKYPELFEDAAHVVACADEKLTGGFVVKTYNQRLDGSFRKALLRLYEELRTATV